MWLTIITRQEDRYALWLTPFKTIDPVGNFYDASDL